MKNETAVISLKERFKKIKCFFLSHRFLIPVILLSMLSFILSFILTMSITIILVVSDGGIKEIYDYPDNIYSELEIAICNFDIEDEEYKGNLRKLGIDYSFKYIQTNDEEGNWEVILSKPTSSTFEPDIEVEYTCKEFDINKENFRDIKRNYESELMYKVGVGRKLYDFIFCHFCCISVLLLFITNIIYVWILVYKENRNKNIT